MVVLIRASPRGLRFSLSPREPRGGQNQICEPSVSYFGSILAIIEFSCKLCLVFLFVLGPVNVFRLLSTTWAYTCQFSRYLTLQMRMLCMQLGRPGRNTFFCPGVRGGRLKVRIVIGVAREIILANLSLGLFAITGGSG